MGGRTSSEVQPYDGDMKISSNSTLVIVKVTQTEIGLLWEDAYTKARGPRTADPEKGAIKVHLQRRTDQGDWIDLRTDSVFGYTDTHLEPREAYAYRIKFEHTEGSGVWSGDVRLSADYRGITSLNKALENLDADETVKVLKNFSMAGFDHCNIRQYQEALHAEKRTLSKPVTAADIQRIVKQVNLTCAVVVLNKALDINPGEVTTDTITATAERSYGIQDQLIDEYRTILKEVKEMKGKKHKGKRKPGQDSDTSLQPDDIAKVITCVNGFKTYIKLDKALESNNKENTIVHLRQLALKDFEEANTDDYYSSLLNGRDKARECMEIRTDVKEILFLKRLNQRKAQRCIDTANFECAVRTIVVSVEMNNEGETDAALRNRYAGIHSLRSNTQHAYLTVLRKTHLEQGNISESRNLRDKIQKAVDDYNWLLSINEAITKKNRKSVMTALGDNTHVSNFKRNKPGYDVLLWDAQNKKKLNCQHCVKDDIYKDILTQEEVQEVVNYHPLLLDIDAVLSQKEHEDRLYHILKNDHDALILKNLILNLPEHERRCYLTALKEAKDVKKSKKSSRWCWSSGEGPYDESLSHCEVQAVVEGFRRVKTVNETLDKLDTEVTLEALQSLKSFSDSDEWGEINRTWSAEYYTLLKEERHSKLLKEDRKVKKETATERDTSQPNKQKEPKTGFEKMLTNKEIQNIIKVHPWITSINTFLERHVKTTDSQSPHKQHNGYVGSGAGPEPSHNKAEGNPGTVHQLMTMLRTPDCSRYWRTNKKGTRENGYFVLLLKAFREKREQSEVSSRETSSRYRRWMTKNEIREVIEDYTWLVDINNAIEEGKSGDIIRYLKSRRAYMKKPKPTETDVPGYSVLLLEALNKKRMKKKSSQDRQEDIYKDILRRPEIKDTIHFHPVLRDLNTAVELGNKESLATILEEPELQLPENVIPKTHPEDMCYLTLMSVAKRAKDVSTMGKPYKTCLTHSEVEKIVQVHNIVVAVNEACEERTTWKTLWERHPGIAEFFPAMDKTRCSDEYLRILLYDEKKIKVDNWEKLTNDVEKEKNKKVSHNNVT